MKLHFYLYKKYAKWACKNEKSWKTSSKITREGVCKDCGHPAFYFHGLSGGIPPIGIDLVEARLGFWPANWDEACCIESGGIYFGKLRESMKKFTNMALDANEAAKDIGLLGTFLYGARFDNIIRKLAFK